MRKIFILILLTVAVCLSAQQVNYSSSSSYGCRVTFTVNKQDGKYFLYTEIYSRKLRLQKNVVIKMRNFRDEVITLNGEVITNDSETEGMMIGNIAMHSTAYSSTAIFSVRPDQFAAMTSGIKKIQINTVPEIHEKTFTKDKIGKKLYRLYQIAYSKSEF